MQHCDKARPGTPGGGGARLQRPGASAPLAPGRQAASLSPRPPPRVTGSREKALKRRVKGAGGAKQNGDTALPFPLPAASRHRGAGANPRPPPRAPPRNPKCGREGTRLPRDAPSPPRAPTYRLKPCPRTRAQAAKQPDSRRLRRDAARTERPRLLRPP